MGYSSLLGIPINNVESTAIKTTDSLVKSQLTSSKSGLACFKKFFR